MAKNVKKYYAIKEGKGVKDKIVRTWGECKELVLGYPAVYKSFKTEEEAKAYLGKIDVKKVKEQTKVGIEKKKKVKATTRLIQTRIDKELYEQFANKCAEMEQEEDIVIKNMIKEWVL